MQKLMAVVLSLTMVLGILTGCIGRSPRMEETDISVAGSSTVMPLGEACAEIFNMNQSKYQISVMAGGTGVGITNIAENRSSIAMASREIKPSEREKYETGTRKFQEYLVGYDGIVMVVSPTIYDGGITNVSKDDVKRIYNGNITNWKDLGGPDRQILVVSRELGSGTRDSFNEIVIGMAKAETPGVNTVLGSSAEIKTTIANSNNAIGYLGYSYVKSGGVRAVAYDGVMPTIENIKSRKYPLARSLYMYTFGEPGPGAKVYIDFVQSPDGQKIAEENGFISI